MRDKIEHGLVSDSGTGTGVESDFSHNQNWEAWGDKGMLSIHDVGSR